MFRGLNFGGIAPRMECVRYGDPPWRMQYWIKNQMTNKYTKRPINLDTNCDGIKSMQFNAVLKAKHQSTDNKNWIFCLFSLGRPSKDSSVNSLLPLCSY